MSESIVHLFQEQRLNKLFNYYHDVSVGVKKKFDADIPLTVSLYQDLS